MRPLIFLTVRSTLNGLRRALTSPQRLISILFFVGWYFLWFVSPALKPNREMHLPPEAVGRLDFPPMAAIEAVVFTVFAILSLFMALNALSPKQGFRPADVDVLFPTPVSHKLVLAFRIGREYLVNLLLPLFITLIGLRPVSSGWQALFRNVQLPDSAGLVGRMMFVAWIGLAMSWVSISFAGSLFVNRSDERSDRNKRWMSGAGIGILLGVVGFVALELRGASTVQQFISLAQSPVLRIAFFPAEFAANLVMAPLTGEIWPALIGLAGLAAIIGVSFKLAMTQAGWLYDQAAARAFDTASTRAMAVKGDYFGSVAAAARAGKFRARSALWADRLRLQGPLALVWKELILQTRSMRGTLIAFLVVAIAMNAVPALVPIEGKATEVAILFAVMQGATVLVMGMGLAQTGFVEVLKRVDLQKPLPFPASTTVFMEIAAKATPTVVAVWLGALVAVALRPDLLRVALGTGILAIPAALLVTATVFLMTVLFPDVEDPTQRSFRNLMVVLGVVICSAGGVGLFAGLWAIGAHPALAAVPAAALSVAISVVLATVSGRLYSAYNPSE